MKIGDKVCSNITNQFGIITQILDDNSAIILDNRDGEIIINTSYWHLLYAQHQDINPKDNENILTYNIIHQLAKRARYKQIKDSYCYFVFNGYRIESLIDDNSEIVCIVKGGSPKKTNDDTTFNSNIIYISDNVSNVELVYEEQLYMSFKDQIELYLAKHKNWIS